MVLKAFPDHLGVKLRESKVLIELFLLQWNNDIKRWVRWWKVNSGSNFWVAISQPCQVWQLNHKLGASKGRNETISRSYRLHQTFIDSQNRNNEKEVDTESIKNPDHNITSVMIFVQGEDNFAAVKMWNEI